MLAAVGADAGPGTPGAALGSMEELVLDAACVEGLMLAEAGVSAAPGTPGDSLLFSSSSSVSSSSSNTIAMAPSTVFCEANQAANSQ